VVLSVEGAFGANDSVNLVEGVGHGRVIHYV
jgi:hypothetical protein